MLIGLATLIILLLGGGSDTFLLNPHLKKNVKHYVEDNNRRKEVFTIIGLIEKDQKAFLKKRGKYYSHKLIELNTRYASKPEEFQTLFTEYHNERTSLQNKYLDNELKIRSLILQEEWDNIMAAIIEKTDKQKAQSQVEKLNEKTYARLIHGCEKIISKTETREKATALLNEHEQKTNDFMMAFLNLGYQNLESIQKYNVTRADFEPIRAEMAARHQEYLKSVIDLRFNLVELSTPEEWKMLSKELNKIFKEGEHMI